MSKNQEPETPEPAYEEPEYETTLGKKERDLTSEMEKLMKLSKNKKGKKNRKEAQQEGKSLESSASSSQQITKTKKKTVINDLNELKNFNFSNVSAPVATETKPTIEKISQAQYKNTAILATVSGQIEESDIQRFFNGLSIYKIHPEQGYYIIEFSTEEDLRKALQKNKTPYTNNITVLVGEYSIEDENPKPEKHDYGRMYPRREYSHDDFDDDYSQSSSRTAFSVGAKYQQQADSNKFQVRKQQQPSFQLGAKFGSQQQQPESNRTYQAYKGPSTVPSQTAKYTPKTDIGFLSKESHKPITTGNNRFGNLMNDDNE